MKVFILCWIVLQLPIDIQETSTYFEEIKAYCDQDNGKLWGENLWAPILVIDSKTRFLVANNPDKEGQLTKLGNVYTGYFPKNKAVANSTTEFGGENWMMVMHPLPGNHYNRNQLSLHELYHRLQNKLKLDFRGYDNSHMDSKDARILLKLEWMALEEAIKSNGSVRAGHLQDALIFRNYRRQLYPGSDSMENKFEMHEGMAEYTGHKICSKNNDEFKIHTLKSKEGYWNRETFVRSFAYHSGLLYGYLLDQKTVEWRNKIEADSDLGEMIQVYYKIEMPLENLEGAYQQSQKNYDSESIIQYENERERKQKEVLNAYRRKFTNDTILILQTPNPGNVVFNPNNLIPLDSLGTVYPTFRIIHSWGTLQVNEGGCLFNWEKAIVSARNMKTEKNRISGEGWELDLNEGWKVIRDESNYRVVKVE